MGYASIIEQSWKRLMIKLKDIKVRSYISWNIVHHLRVIVSETI